MLPAAPQEYKTLNALSGSMFGLGVVVLLLGVHLLTGGKPPEQQVWAREGPEKGACSEQRANDPAMPPCASRAANTAASQPPKASLPAA